MTTTTPVVIPEPSSMSDVRALFAETAPETKAEPKPATPEVKPEPEKAPVETKSPEPTTGTGEEKQQAQEVEEELPENVKKRIAREVAKQSRIDEEIRKATSTTKAKEAELAKLKTGTPGSEPAPNTEPAKTTKPVRPDISKFEGTVLEWQAAVDKYTEEYLAWHEAETEKRISAQIEQRERDKQARAEREKAIQKHGADFPELMDTLRASSPEAFQVAVSDLEDWDTVAVHLAKNPDVLKPIVAKFAVNRTAAIAELGRLEERLKAPAKPQTEVKPAAKLPEPVPVVGGKATAAAEEADANKMTYPQLKRMLNRTYTS